MFTLLPTSYLPPISYLSACRQADELLVEVHETYPKQTIRNHCLIYGPNGVQKLSIPVNKVHGNHTPTNEIRITYDQNWQLMHWRSIETAYNNSPFFLYYRDYFEPFYLKRYDYLVDFNRRLLEEVFILLRIEKSISFSESYLEIYEQGIDLRTHFGQKRKVVQEPFVRYTQVFEERFGFIPNLSILDLIFNLGPEAIDLFL